MKKIVILLYICISLFSLNAQEIELCDSSTISILTCSPGKEVYSKFGHTAIRIKDTTTNTDIIFNYGIFSFETTNFYYKFIKGETDYQLGVYETKYFLPEYAARNSMVYEQTLNLNIEEKRKLINSLRDNYKPENRIYRYNFIFDNCATRPRDKIINSLSGFVKYRENTDNKTFRQWVGVYVGTDTWLKFGIDLIFGLDADRITTKRESMFLPEVLKSEFETAQIIIPNADTKPLVTNTTILVQQNPEKTDTILIIYKPLFIGIIILLVGLIITLLDWYKIYSAKLFDSILLTITGIAGLIVLYMMVISIHPLVKNNLNILWLNPLNLLVAIFIWVRSFKTTLFFYQFANILFLTFALLAFALSIQDFNIASFPIIVLLLLRSTAWFAKTKRKIIKRSSGQNTIKIKSTN